MSEKGGLRRRAGLLGGAAALVAALAAFVVWKQERSSEPFDDADRSDTASAVAPVASSRTDPFDGRPRRLTALVTEARRRSLEWNGRADLVRIEASGFSEMKLATRAGGRAQMTYEVPLGGLPGSPGAEVTERLVVLYDRDGMRETPSYAKPSGPGVEHPECPADEVLRVLSGQEREARALIYLKDPDRKGPVWVALFDGMEQDERFAGDTCAILRR